MPLRFMPTVHLYCKKFADCPQTASLPVFFVLVSVVEMWPGEIQTRGKNRFDINVAKAYFCQTVGFISCITSILRINEL